MLMSVAALLAALVMSLAGHPVKVHCSNYAPPEIRSTPTWVGWAWVGRPVITLRPRECLRASLGNYWSLHTLAHEVGHSTGIASETGANRYALKHMPALVRKWGVLTATTP